MQACGKSTPACDGRLDNPTLSNLGLACPHASIGQECFQCHLSIDLPQPAKLVDTEMQTDPHGLFFWVHYYMNYGHYPSGLIGPLCDTCWHVFRLTLGNRLHTMEHMLSEASRPASALPSEQVEFASVGVPSSPVANDKNMQVCSIIPFFHLSILYALICCLPYFLAHYAAHFPTP